MRLGVMERIDEGAQLYGRSPTISLSIQVANPSGGGGKTLEGKDQ